MPIISTALVREPANIQEYCAAICFQSVGQVVTVLGKIGRHFENEAVAVFAKQAVAEYAAKENAQLVAVTILQDAGVDAPDDARLFTHDGQHYAISIGNLADERTQMGHLIRVMERLKYLQAVMVMLSTTDMLGTSQALGKHMGGMTQRLQQVQKIGLQLEKLTSRIEEAKKRNQPLSQKVFEKQLTRLLTQMQKLQAGAPPELRRVLQTMIAQVKEMRQWPALSMTQRLAVTPLKVVEKHDAAPKADHRFKTQPAKLALKVVEGRHTMPLPVNRAAVIGRVTPNQFYILPSVITKIAVQTKPANDNRFRVANSMVTRVVANAARKINAPTQIAKHGVQMPNQRRFTALNVVPKLPVALTVPAVIARAATSTAFNASILPAASILNAVRQAVPVQTLQAHTIQHQAVQTQQAQTVRVQLAVSPTPEQPQIPVQSQLRATPQATSQPVSSVQPSSLQAGFVQAVQPAMIQQPVLQQPVVQQTVTQVATILQTAVQHMTPPDVVRQPNSPVQNITMPDGLTQNAAATPRAVVQQAVVQGGVNVSASGDVLPPQLRGSDGLNGHDAKSPPLVAAAVTSVPIVPRVEGASIPAPLSVTQTANPPIIQQYQKAAQDFGERVVRGANQLQVQVKHHVDAVAQAAVQQVSGIVARGVPSLQLVSDKVNGAITTAFDAAAKAACAIACAMKMPCSFCSRPAPKANQGMMNNMKALQKS